MFLKSYERQWKSFKSKKLVRGMIALLSLILLSSLCAEWITNSKPVIASYKGNIIIPAYVDYNWIDFNSTNGGEVDYRTLKEDFSWSFWPLLNWSPYEVDEQQELLMSPPSKSHLMGTDSGGRDVFARLIYGTRISFFFAFMVWITTYLLGTFLGVVQGYWGGKFDILMQRFIEMWGSIPEFYILLLLVTILNPSIFLLVPLASLFGWIGIAQYMRAEALKNRRLTFVEAAKSAGNSDLNIMLRHILPNSLTPLITFSPFAIIGGLIGLASLDMLGFGVPAPTPSWGELLDQAQNNFQVAWWLAFFPSLFLFLSVVSLNIIGEGLRSAFDPREK